MKTSLMESTEERQQLDGVDPTGVYSGLELMEADDDLDYSASGSQSPQPDLFRMTQEQILAQVQGGQLIPGPSTQQTGTTPSSQGDPPPNITVNHTYNIHYQSDRPPPENARDIAAYGQELIANMNNRSMEICAVDTSMPTDIEREPAWRVEPRLEYVKFYNGRTGMDFDTKYIPDAKYKKHNVRNLNGKVIELKDLHAKTGRNEDRVIRHVALIGNAGCGKTVLTKRYCRMVLNRQIPDLEDVEVVHYMKVSELYDSDTRLISVRDMLLERLVHTSHDNVIKFGFKWIRTNPEKVLFVFDGADSIISKFGHRTERISYDTETTLKVVLENIITDHLFRGCKTLVSARDWAWKTIKGDSRPQKFVSVGPLTEEIKLGLTRSIIPGNLGEEFCTYLSRCFPGAFSLASDAMYLYFAISGLQWGDDFNNSKVTTDVMLIIVMLQHLLRSWNSNPEIINRIPKLRLLAYNMICDEHIRFGLRELRHYKGKEEIKLEDMQDCVVICPFHHHHVCYRLMDIDFSYFFQHQILQEALAAFHIADMKLEEFREFVTRKIHTRKWVVIRRFVCGILLNVKTKKNLMYYINDRRDQKYAEDMEAVLQTSMLEETKRMDADDDSLSSFDRLELLSSLCEAGEAARHIIEHHVTNICIPDVILAPSDLYIISQLKPYIRKLRKVEMCLGKDINTEEFDALVETVILKAKSIHLDIARLQLTMRHVESVKLPFQRIMYDARRGGNKTNPYPQTVLLVNTKTPDEVMKGLKKILQTPSKDPIIRVQKIEVPIEEVAILGEQNCSSLRRGRHCDVM